MKHKGNGKCGWGQSSCACHGSYDIMQIACLNANTDLQLISWPGIPPGFGYAVSNNRDFFFPHVCPTRELSRSVLTHIGNEHRLTFSEGSTALIKTWVYFFFNKGRCKVWILASSIWALSYVKGLIWNKDQCLRGEKQTEKYICMSLKYSWCRL